MIDGTEKPTICKTHRRDTTNRGGFRIFFRRGCTRLLLYFNTNKPHSFFFWQNTSCIRKPQVISGGGMRTLCTLPLDKVWFYTTGPRPPPYFWTILRPKESKEIFETGPPHAWSQGLHDAPRPLHDLNENKIKWQRWDLVDCNLVPSVSVSPSHRQSILACTDICIRPISTEAAIIMTGRREPWERGWCNSSLLAWDQPRSQVLSPTRRREPRGRGWRETIAIVKLLSWIYL